MVYKAVEMLLFMLLSIFGKLLPKCRHKMAHLNYDVIFFQAGGRGNLLITCNNVFAEPQNTSINASAVTLEKQAKYDNSCDILPGKALFRTHQLFTTLAIGSNVLRRSGFASDAYHTVMH